MFEIYISLMRIYSDWVYSEPIEDIYNDYIMVLKQKSTVCIRAFFLECCFGEST